MTTDEHTHTSLCWKSGETACVEFKIRELEGEIIFWRGIAVKVQAGLRQAKGFIDRMESEVTRAIAKEK